MEDVIRIDVAKVVKTLWKGKWKMLLAGLVCAGVLFGYSLATGPRYETAVTFFAGTPEKARQAAVLLELEQTMAEVEDLAGMEAEVVRAEEVRETGFLRVTVGARDAAAGKAVADAIFAVLPRRAEEVLGGGISPADPAVMASRPEGAGMQMLAGFLAGMFGCGGLMVAGDVLGVVRRR